MDDDIPLLVEWLVLTGCTIYAMLLTGAESAFSSLPKTTLQELKAAHEGGQSSRVTRWLDNQERLFTTLLIGKTTTTAGVVISVVALVLTPQLTDSFGSTLTLTLSGLFAIGLLLVLIEWLPRLLVSRYSDLTVRASAVLVLVSYWLFWPLITPLLVLNLRMARAGLFSSGRNPYWLDDELHRVLELEETRELKPDDKEMISSIIEMHDTSVREVMVPRVDMVCAEKSRPIPELLELIREMGHSRIPIYGDSVDDIMGVVYAKDLLQLSEDPDGEKNLKDLLRPPYVVPETKKAAELLKEFQREKIHLAIVVDEHGTTAGLVTLEDLLEEIVGEIQDEYDDEDPLYESLPDGSLLVHARLNIDTLNDLLDLDITPDGFETVGGLVFNELGRVPEPGEDVSFRNFRIVVREVEGQRIIKAVVSRLHPQSEEGGAGSMEDRVA